MAAETRVNMQMYSNRHPPLTGVDKTMYEGGRERERKDGTESEPAQTY